MHTDTWEIYQDKKEEWRWRRTAANGRIVGKSSEGYKNRADVEKNAERYGYNGKYKPDGDWEFYQDKKSEWRWRHTVAQSNIIGASSEGYAAKKDAIANAERHGYKA